MHRQSVQELVFWCRWMCPAPGRSLSWGVSGCGSAAEHGQPCDSEGQAAAPLLPAQPCLLRACSSCGVVDAQRLSFPFRAFIFAGSEIAELKLLNKPDWIQGSRSGSPLCLPQKRGEEKFLWVLQGIVWLVGERKARQGFLIPSLLFLPVKGLKDIIVFFLWFMFLNYSLVFRCGSLSANATEMKIKTSQWTSSWDDLHLRK